MKSADKSFDKHRAQPPGGRCGAAEHPRPGFRVQVENRTWSGDGTDLPAGAAGQTAQAAQSGAGCRTGSGRCAGADRGELGGEEALTFSPTKLASGWSRASGRAIMLLPKLLTVMYRLGVAHSNERCTNADFSSCIADQPGIEGVGYGHPRLWRYRIAPR